MNFSILLSALGLAGVLAAGPTVDWPGDPVVRVADDAGRLGGNLSGLAADGADGLWAVRDTGALLRLARDGGGYVPRDGWGDGRALRFPDGHDGPDAEAVTTSDGDPGAVYVGSERDNDEGGRSRNSVLRFETGGSGALQATREWDLTDVLPSTPSNSGIEGLTWIADDALVAAGLRTGAGEPYAPASVPAHGGGLFVVGLERDGGLYLVVLTDGGGASLVASMPSGLDRVMEVVWSAERGELWALCDDGCSGRASVFRANGSGFEQVAEVKPPRGMADLNDEGFAFLPCAGGVNTVVWADDLATDDHALRTSSLPCGSITGEATATPPSTATVASTAAAPSSTSSPDTSASTTPAVPADSSVTPTSTAGSAAPTTAATTGDGDDGGSSGAVLGVVAVVALAGAGGGVLLARRRAR